MWNSTYQEKYLIRKRTFTIEPNGVRVIKNSFFGDNEIFYPIEEIGPHIQYDKNPLLLNAVISLVMLIIGVKILLGTTTDNFIFIIGTSLIGGAIYWIINTILSLNYIGSYYFSHTTKKSKDALEIKSSYPANEQLSSFLRNIINLQITRKIDRLIESINMESKFIHLENRAKEIKRNSDLSDEEYEELIDRIKIKIEENTEDNKL